MDLSVEAEAFGCDLHESENEIPTTVGRRVTDQAGAEALRVPVPGEKRTSVYLETVSRLAGLPDQPLVLAGCIGPFSLAGRLYGLSECYGATLMEPELIHLLLQKSTTFLKEYALAFRAAGAGGLVMAEPAAGLLSPRGMAEFSSAYVRQIVEAVEDDRFQLILHNCAAKVIHLPAVLESGATALHFGAAMDLPAALDKVSPEVILCGNLDPSAVFVQGTADRVRSEVLRLLQETRGHSNFVISSGCDVPAGTSLATMDVFFDAVRSWEPVLVR
jgi:uroporphyrinogen decarboxylase